jgi:predicted TIM-barrel fold metal-dependent hydrolase
MFCEFPYAALEDLIRRALQAFGPERIMWGSNFPVCGEDPAEYRRGADLVQEHHWGLDSRAAELITDTTARRLWFR